MKSEKLIFRLTTETTCELTFFTSEEVTQQAIDSLISLLGVTRSIYTETLGEPLDEKYAIKGILEEEEGDEDDDDIDE